MRHKTCAMCAARIGSSRAARCNRFAEKSARFAQDRQGSGASGPRLLRLHGTHAQGSWQGLLAPCIHRTRIRVVRGAQRRQELTVDILQGQPGPCRERAAGWVNQRQGGCAQQLGCCVKHARWKCGSDTLTASTPQTARLAGTSVRLCALDAGSPWHAPALPASAWRTGPGRRGACGSPPP